MAYGLLDSSPLDGFEQIVGRVYLESGHGIFGRSGHEDQQRSVGQAGQRHPEGQSVGARQANVQEGGIHLRTFAQTQPVARILGLSHDLHPAGAGEQIDQIAARQRLVLDYHRADHPSSSLDEAAKETSSTQDQNSVVTLR